MTIVNTLGTSWSKTAGLRYPKLLLWGSYGTGKTVTALYIAHALRLKTLAQDADGGLAAYAGHPGWAGLGDLMTVVSIEDPIQSVNLLEELLRVPQGYQLMIQDPISTIWRRSQIESEQFERTKATRRNESPYAQMLHKGSWGPIKRLSFLLTSDARRLGMSLISTAREATEYSSNGAPLGLKPDAEKNVGHDFDVVIHLEQPVEGGKRVATVNKDRWARLPLRWEGEASDPFWAAKELIRHYRELFTQASVANPRASEEQVYQLYRLQADTNTNAGLVAARLMEVFGVSQYSELTPDDADRLIGIYRASLIKQPKPEPQREEAVEA